MYWLIFFNGIEIPEIEAGFACSEALMRYVDCIKDCHATLTLYTVLFPGSAPISLSDFIDIHKEF